MTLRLQASSRLFSGWPVRDLLQRTGFQSKNNDNRIAMGLFTGFSCDVRASRTQSHLTHSTDIQHQIRFPMRRRIDRSVRKLATEVAPLIASDLIVEIAADDELSIEFFHELEKQGVRVTSIPSRVPDESRGPDIQDVETGFEVSHEKEILRMLNDHSDLPNLIEAAQERTYSGDYRTAYQMLIRIPEDCRNGDVHHHLGMCTNYFDRTDESEQHYLRCMKSDDIIMRASAAYMISMLYLRWHRSERLNLDIAEAFLNRAYDEIDAISDRETREFHRVFNRNGYALCLYRRGRVEEAFETLKDGVAVLDNSIARLDKNGGLSHRYLHRSVLLYNAVQCLATLRHFAECEAMCTELIAADPLFPEYHLEAGRIYLMQSDLSLEKVHQALASFAEAERLDSAIPELHALKGYALMELGRWAGATAAYAEALRLEPSNSQFSEALEYCRENQNAVIGEMAVS